MKPTNYARILTILIVIMSLFSIYTKNSGKIGQPGMGSPQKAAKAK